MRRQLILCLFVYVSFFLITSCVTKQTTPDQKKPLELSSISIIDRNGFTETLNAPERLKQYQNVNFLESQPYQKVLRVYSRDSEGNITALITSYYPNGQVKQYLETVNNRAYGKYYEWHSNGVLKLDANIIGGVADITAGAENTWLFDGCSFAWDENGELLGEIPYAKGELDGVSLYYHKNGSIWKSAPFCNNRLHGTLKIYLDNGQLFQTTEYSQGLNNGPSIRYWNNDLICSDESYSNGLLMTGRYYDSCGELIAQIDEGTGFRALFSKETLFELQEYHDGVLDGQVDVYAPNGDILKIYHIKNALKHGEEIEFQIHAITKKATPKISITWFENKIQGIVKTWYDNGAQESQRDISNNAKNGLATAWYKNGSLMLIEEYDRDKLVKGEYYHKGEKVPISQVTDGKGTATIYDAEGHFVRKITYYNGKPLE